MSLYYANISSIAKTVSDEMKRLLDDTTYRKAVKSPNGRENPFEKEEVISDIKSLKEALDTLILDVSAEILTSPVVKRALLTY